MPDDQARGTGIVADFVCRSGRGLGLRVLVDLDLICDAALIDFRRGRGRSSGFSHDPVSAAASAQAWLSSADKQATVDEERLA